MNKFPGRDYLVSDSKYLKLNLTIPHEEILNEAKQLRDRFVPYYSSYSHSGWHSLPIVGIDSTKPGDWTKYGYASATEAAYEMSWTDIADLCPITKEWLTSVYPSNSYGRVRFMLLEAGGEIGYHSDTIHSVLSAVNIALNNPKGCKWHWRDGDSLEFNPGDIYSMNISYEHSIKNPTNEDRYHMIIHHYDSTDEYKQLLINSMEANNVKGNFHYSSKLF